MSIFPFFLAIYLLFCCLLQSAKNAKRLLPALVLGIIFSAPLCAQQAHLPLVSKGPIPKDFMIDYANKEEATFWNVQKNEKFYEQNAFFLNRLLTSGKILFGDTATQYINYLADIILQNEPELRQQLRFYAARIPSANAYCANNGIVLVNVGLLAQVENEAQLAFILCHEISHFVAKHPLRIYMDSQKEGNLQRPEEILLSQTLYSQAIEYEADSLGMRLYLATPFAPKAALDAITITEYPEIIFPYFPLKTNWKKNTKENVDNTSPQKIVLSPTTLARQQHLSHYLPAKTAKQSLTLSSQRFQFVQKICRFEMCRYQIERQMYEQALYNALCLQQWYHIESDFLNKSIIYSAYGLCKYINTGRFWEIHQDYANTDNSFEQLCAYFELEPRLDLHIEVIKNIKTLRKQKDSPFLAQIHEDLYKEIGKHYVKEVSAEGNITFINEVGSRDLIEMPDSNYYEVIKSAFFDQKQVLLGSNKGKKSESKRQKNWLFKGFNLGIDTVVFVEPSYQRIDLRKSKTEEMEVSTAMQTGMIQKIKEYSAAQNIQAYLLHSSELKPNRVEYFNRLCLLNDWMSEKSALKELEMFTFCHEEVQALVERYNTPYFAWMGGRHIMHKQNWKPSLKIENMLTFPFASINSETFFYVFVYDLQTEKYLVLYPRYVSMKDRADVFHSIIYDMIFQIHQGEKK